MLCCAENCCCESSRVTPPQDGFTPLGPVYYCVGLKEMPFLWSQLKGVKKGRDQLKVSVFM